MGLLNTYNNSLNMETQQSLIVTYSVQEMSEFTGYYKATRYATKYYKYVGMTQAAATQCAKDKVTQYTRTFSRVVTDNSTESPTPVIRTIKECKSSIAAQKVNGCMYETVIQVNEYDEKYSSRPITDPASLFVSENQRNYDDDTSHSGSLTVVDWTDAWKGEFLPYITSLTLDGSNIPGFPTSYPERQCTVMCFVQQQGSWIPTQYVPNSGWMIPCPPLQAAGWDVIVKYGTYESQIIRVCGAH